ncbi:hypothetical protein BDM02DRAFT_2511201 [Thelephora ganbajun]|uniref:Uncharacterized protein n=1 Tax=Thelephora ganbajun TaxID=370292 RepID=A0ACB6YYG1_THEGA|nr:hypothetical protein BDM02DRAFT_2511201 [Thelephora ganbajun]
MIFCPIFFFDESMYRKPSPSGRLSTSSHVWSHWKNASVHAQVTWRSKGAGRKSNGMSLFPLQNLC